MDAFFPPGPQKHFVAGNAHQFTPNPFAFVTESARTFGELVHFRFGPAHAYLINHPREAHYVLCEAPERFTDRPNWFKTLNSGMGHDLFTPRETARRHACVKTAYDPRWLPEYADQIADAALMLGWSPDDTPYLPTHLKAMTTRMIARLLFDQASIPTGLSEGIGFTRPFDERMFHSPLIPTWLPISTRRGRPGALAGLNAAVSALIAHHQQEERCGIFARLLYVAPTVEAAVDEMLTLFYAGSEIVANTLAWALYLLATNPDQAAELRAELHTLLAGEPPTSADLPYLSVTETVIRETLRLYPPVWLIRRQATRETQIGRFYVPSGSTLYVSPYAIHHNPRQFIDPEAFLPQRFASGYERRINPFSYLPFGAGARASMEESFVVTLSTLLLAAIAGRWEFTAARPAPQIEAGLTLKPSSFRLSVATPERVCLA
ncbi:MAG: cytochrome P450 [Anaerolinea sp.]|nr:cytochrome P450 [Anaerolinea sp.]